MQIKIVGNANLSQAQAQFAAFQKQVEALNTEMAKSAMIPQGGNPAGFSRQARAASAATSAYNAALASSGAFRVEQIKINDEVSKTTEALGRQKLAFNKVFGKQNKKMMESVYREQVKMRQGYAQINDQMVGDGKQRFNLAIPTQVHGSWDTLNNRVGFFRERLASASAEMINWGKNTQWAGRQLMAGISMPIAAFGAAAGVMAYQSDKAIAQITKVYDFSAAAQADSAVREREVGDLRVKTLENATWAAKQYGASIASTLDVQQQLAATGLAGRKLFDTTNEVQRISTLGDIDPSQTTEMIVALQTAFRDTIKDGDDLSGTLNFMNAASNATSLSLQDIAEATPRAASALSSLGVTAEEMTVLLVSMRENGVNAAEGANALKSATTRILNPVRKATAFYDKYGVSISNLSEQSGGNLFDFLKLLGKEQQKIQGPTEKQTQYLRAQGIAALFGTYQYNRLNASLVNMGDAMSGNADDANQTRKAMELMGMSAEEMARRADASLKDVTETASGRFKRAFETLKAELAEVGQPFLEVASAFLKVTSAALGFFNSLPSGVKKAVLIGAMLGALVGPIVMLIGLFANFAANMGRFVAWSLKAVTSFRVMDKAQWAAKVSAEMSSQAWTKQASSAEVMHSRVSALTLALENYARVQAHTAGVALPAGFGQGPSAAGMVHGPARPTNDQLTGAYMTQMQDKTGRYRDPENRMRVLTKEKAQVVAQERLTAKIAANENSSLKSRMQTDKIAARTAGSMNGMAVSSALGAASIAAMVMPLGEGATSVAQMALLGSIVVPAAQMLLPPLRAAVTTMTALAVRSAAAGFAMKKNVGIAAAMGATMRGAATGIAGLMGPIGWAALAIAATGFAVYKIHKNSEESIKRQIEQQKILNKTTDTWADTLGVAAQDRKKMSLDTWAGPENEKSPMELADAFGESAGGKKLVGAYNDASAAEKQTIALGQYLMILRETDATTEQARKGLETMFLAAGDGAIEAKRKAQDLYDEVGALAGDADMERLWSQQLTNVMDGIYDEASEAGKSIGQILGDSIAGGANGSERDAGLKNFTNSINTAWTNLIGDMNDTSQDLLADAGIDASNIKTFIADWQKVAENEMSQADFLSSWNLDDVDPGSAQVLMNELNGMIEGSGEAADKLREAERGIVKELSGQLGISREIASLSELRATWEWQLYTATKANAKALFDQKVAGETEGNNILNSLGITKDRLGLEKEVTAERKLEILNQIRIAMGMKEAVSLAQGFKEQAIGGADATGKTREQVKRLAGDLRGLPAGLVNLKFKVEDIANIQKSGMEGVMSDLADAGNEAFSNRMDASIEAAQAAWDARQEALQDSQDAQMERFENRYDRMRKTIEKRYDTQVKGIEKAIEAEQKAEQIRQDIFEAEKTRIERLAESANRTIDFNMALQTGDLDEAAKIRNDINATSQEWALSDAAENGGKRSDRKVETLEDRKEALDKRKDLELDALSKREDAERKHLERVQEMRSDALAKQASDNMKFLKNDWDQRKKSYDKQMALLAAMPVANEKQLAKALKLAGLRIEDFGFSTAAAWGKFFKNSMSTNTRQAGLEIAKSAMWARLGKKTAKEILFGMGFGSLGKFKKFIQTGDLPDDFGNPKRPNKPKSGKGAGGDAPFTNATSTNNFNGGVTRHEGGMAGGGAGSRKGVARNLKGLHPSEVMVRAKKKEFIVNENATKKHGDILNAINNGVYDSTMGGAGTGIAGLMAGALSNMFSVGVGKAIQKTVSQKITQSRLSGNGVVGMLGAAGPGTYGDISFDAEQMKNASTIANVGKNLGMSARDIAIGIMTAIAESSLRNIHGGDRDSQGLFQQRPSQGWGSVEQVTDPIYSATKFFSALKGVGDRNGLSPWMAAQTVQRSAFSDGSNYRQYWDEGQAIFKALNNYSAGYVAGPGGRHVPIRAGSSRNLHGSETGYPAYDFSAPRGTPIYAVADGIISRSYDIGGPLSSDTYRGDGPYGSYGKVIYLKTDAGPEVLYAHLSRRMVQAGQRVTGGSTIGLSGNTGNSSGPHLHFGATNGPMAWLKKGGTTLNDGIAMLHRGETVLTDDLTQDLKTTVKAFGKTSRDMLSGRNRKPVMAKRGLPDSASSSAESWGKETTPVDRASQSAGWTWIAGMMQQAAATAAVRTVKETQKTATSVADTGDAAKIRVGTLNTWVKSTAKATQNDLAKLIPSADFLALTELGHKFSQTKKWLADRNWGLLGGRGRDQTMSAMAYNKNTQNLDKSGIRKLGNLRADIIGGRETRYANYGLFTDKASGRKTWQVAAHTVPAGRGLNPGNAPLYREQWGNLNQLVADLQKSGAPVFVSGDLNVHRGKKNFQTPGNLDEFAARGVDYVFGDKRMSRLIGQRSVNGLNTDHGGGLMSTFALPSHKNGAENIRWDNTLVNMHKKESILTAEQSNKFRNLADNIDNVAGGNGSTYNVNVHVNNPGASAEEIASKVQGVFDRRERRKPIKRGA